VERVRGRARGAEGPFGYMPRHRDLDWKGLDYDRAAYAKITDIRKEDAQREVDSVRRWFPKLGDRLPVALKLEVARLAGRVASQPDTWRAE
jgi:phosphoenolpyruvate carboxykinase (GTP)